jgi:hypothetical protein
VGPHPAGVPIPFARPLPFLTLLDGEEQATVSQSREVFTTSSSLESSPEVIASAKRGST